MLLRYSYVSPNQRCSFLYRIVDFLGDNYNSLNSYPNLLIHRVHPGHKSLKVRLHLHMKHIRVYSFYYKNNNKNKVMFLLHIMYKLILSLQLN